jgi:hypothetical protein
MAATKNRSSIKPAIMIEQAEFARRRGALLDSLQGSIGLVLALSLIHI